MESLQIQKEALKMLEEDRAQLAKELILSLDIKSDEDFNREWLETAEKRSNDVENGKVKTISAEEVREKALSLLK